MDPIIISLNLKQSTFLVFFMNKLDTYEMEIHFKSENNLSLATINCDIMLKKILLPFHSLIVQLQESMNNVSDFVNEIDILLKGEFKKEANRKYDYHFPSYYKIVFEDMYKIGWRNLEFLNYEFNEFHLKHIDTKNRIHLLKLYLNSQHPVIGPDIQTDLPINSKFDWLTCEQSLFNLYNQFILMILECQTFWDFIDEIDLKTWILEPLSYSKSCCRRRIAIDDNVSFEIILDPMHIKQPPNCTFFGPEKKINDLKKCFYNNINKWNEQVSLLENLKNLLEIDFIQKNSTTDMVLEQDCSICYSSDIDGFLPIKRCDAKCPATYHNTCLLQWLKSLPSTRQSFNYLFGDCPNCKKPISIKL